MILRWHHCLAVILIGPCRIHYGTTTAFSNLRHPLIPPYCSQPHPLDRAARTITRRYASSPAKAKSVDTDNCIMKEPPFPRTWVPLASTFELDPNRPNEVHFLGRDYIVYSVSPPSKHSKTPPRDPTYDEWVVTDAVCPHRLAPLAEGRIVDSTTTSNNNHNSSTDSNGSADTVPDSRHLECAYHGWSFDRNGTCVAIPQATPTLFNTIQTKQAAACALGTYTVVVEKNIVWAWLWPDDDALAVSVAPSLSGAASTTPEHFLQGVLPNCTTYTRDLPYSWDVLLENIVDPSHVPWAHHGLQGQRSDAISVNMTVPVVTKEGFTFKFGDRTMKKMRQGIGTFRAPFVIQYKAEFEAPVDTDKPQPKPFDLTAVLIPTKPGWSRIILFGSQQAAATKKTNAKSSLFARIFRNLPVWLVHTLNNRFLDSDLVFLHRQERNLATGERSYFLPAPADRCVAALRGWVQQYAHVMPVPKKDSSLSPQPLSRDVLFDRWTQHGDACRHCSAAMANLAVWRNRTYVALAACVLLHRYLTSRIAAVGCIGLLRLYRLVESSFRQGEFRHYKND